MTRILVISDSHRAIDPLKKIFFQAAGRFDVIVHLGDGCMDIQSYLEDFPDYYMVSGNVDKGSYSPHELPDAIRQVEIEGTKVLMTHGDAFHVKSLKHQQLKIEALKRKVSLVLYGHTHVQSADEEDGIVFFNPGAARDGNYGIIALDNGKLAEAGHYHL